MKNLLQFIFLLIVVAATLFLLVSRLENLEEANSKNSPYQVYDPFKSSEKHSKKKTNSKTKSKKKKNARKSKETVASASTPSAEAGLEEDLSEIDLNVEYLKLQSSISRTNIANIFFTKVLKTCEEETTFTSTLSKLERAGLKSLLFSIENLLPRQDGPQEISKTNIAISSIPKDNILNLNIPNKGRPQLFGIYLCSDFKNQGSCALKSASSDSDITNRVFFFSYAYFDLENLSLLNFPEENSAKYAEKFARTNFGPSDKNALAYLKSKEIIEEMKSGKNITSISMQPASSGAALNFRLSDKTLCLRAKEETTGISEQNDKTPDK